MWSAPLWVLGGCSETTPSSLLPFSARMQPWYRCTRGVWGGMREVWWDVVCGGGCRECWVLGCVGGTKRAMSQTQFSVHIFLNRRMPEGSSSLARASIRGQTIAHE